MTFLVFTRRRFLKCDETRFASQIPSGPAGAIFKLRLIGSSSRCGYRLLLIQYIFPFGDQRF